VLIIEYHHEGLAIFSRWPILSTSHILLSRDSSDRGDFHQRICLCAVIATPYGNISFLTTHLSLSQKARVRSITEIGQFANEVYYIASVFDHLRIYVGSSFLTLLLNSYLNQ
jgi:endonuclease/exonuclease/phosphatase family metal-dependent hydrolase